MSDLLDQPINEEKPKNFVKRYPVYIFIGLFLLGAVFKIQHWPGANTLNGLAIAGVSACILVRLIFKEWGIRKDGILTFFVIYQLLRFHEKAFGFMSVTPYQKLFFLYVSFIVILAVQIAIVAIRKNRRK